MNAGSWAASAACRGRGPSLWFAELDSAESQAGVEVCESCLVRLECLAFAVEARVSDGIWGGVSAADIAKLRRKRRRAA